MYRGGRSLGPRLPTGEKNRWKADRKQLLWFLACAACVRVCGGLCCFLHKLGVPLLVILIRQCDTEISVAIHTLPHFLSPLLNLRALSRSTPSDSLQ